VSASTEAPPGPALLLTKLRPPARRDLFPRPALAERLAGGPPRRLTVVRAGAGWGKTSLMAAWATSDAEARRFAWLALDPGDDDPARFWTYVVAALQTLEPDVGGEALALLTAPGVDAEREALPGLLNDLAELAAPVVLVLDDLHVVGDPAIHRALAFVVEHAPPTLEVAIATRTEPPLPLARLRARGELLELDDRLLRFSHAESEALLNGLAGLGLPAADVEALRRRTEGWAAGLYLAALSLRDRADRDGFIAAFSGDDRHVVDYLAAEVLAALDPGTRAFLLRTSILERLTAPLCDAVTGMGGGRRMLRELERSNLFLVALDDRREVFRYHHLFAELLRGELELAEPRLASELHRRAAAWHLEAGDADRAIRHTIAAGDIAAAVALVAEHWAAWLLNRGDHQAIGTWLRALPAAQVRADPRLCIAQVLVNASSGSNADNGLWLDLAEAAAGADAPLRVRMDLAAMRASHLVQLGDNARALAAAEAALAIGDRTSIWTPIPFGARAHALWWEGDVNGARDAFAGYSRESAAREQLLGVASSHSSRAHIEAEAGRWDTAARHAQLACELAAHALAEHWMMADAHAALARLAAHRGEGDRARDEAGRAVELARRGGVPGTRSNVLLSAARIVGAAEAADLVDEAAAILAPCPDPGPAARARLDAAIRDLSGVRVRAEPAAGEALSERELAVLRLLATDRTQREIGEALYVSLNTVKTHTRHIFRKLGAAGREDAVRHAREAGLLPGA
jgi:LuxR family transcriptional regulator, maltose regulon positive regulatory protein